MLLSHQNILIVFVNKEILFHFIFRILLLIIGNSVQDNNVICNDTTCYVVNGTFSSNIDLFQKPYPSNPCYNLKFKNSGTTISLDNNRYCNATYKQQDNNFILDFNISFDGNGLTYQYYIPTQIDTNNNSRYFELEIVTTSSEQISNNTIRIEIENITLNNGYQDAFSRICSIKNNAISAITRKQGNCLPTVLSFNITDDETNTKIRTCFDQELDITILSTDIYQPIFNPNNPLTVNSEQDQKSLSGTFQNITNININIDNLQFVTGQAQNDSLQFLYNNLSVGQHSMQVQYQDTCNSINSYYISQIYQLYNLKYVNIQDQKPINCNQTTQSCFQSFQTPNISNFISGSPCRAFYISNSDNSHYYRFDQFNCNYNSVNQTMDIEYKLRNGSSIRNVQFEQNKPHKNDRSYFNQINLDYGVYLNNIELKTTIINVNQNLIAYDLSCLTEQPLDLSDSTKQKDFLENMYYVSDRYGCGTDLILNPDTFGNDNDTLDYQINVVYPTCWSQGSNISDSKTIERWQFTAVIDSGTQDKTLNITDDLVFNITIYDQYKNIYIDGETTFSIELQSGFITQQSSQKIIQQQNPKIIQATFNNFNIPQDFSQTSNFTIYMNNSNSECSGTLDRSLLINDIQITINSFTIIEPSDFTGACFVNQNAKQNDTQTKYRQCGSAYENYNSLEYDEEYCETKFEEKQSIQTFTLNSGIIQGQNCNSLFEGSDCSNNFAINNNEILCECIDQEQETGGVDINFTLEYNKQYADQYCDQINQQYVCLKVKNVLENCTDDYNSTFSPCVYDMDNVANIFYIKQKQILNESERYKLMSYFNKNYIHTYDISVNLSVDYSQSKIQSQYSCNQTSCDKTSYLYIKLNNPNNIPHITLYLYNQNNNKTYIPLVADNTYQILYYDINISGVLNLNAEVQHIYPNGCPKQLIYNLNVTIEVNTDMKILFSQNFVNINSWVYYDLDKDYTAVLSKNMNMTGFILNYSSDQLLVFESNDSVDCQISIQIFQQNNTIQTYSHQCNDSENFKGKKNEILQIRFTIYRKGQIQQTDQTLQLRIKDTPDNIDCIQQITENSLEESLALQNYKYSSKCQDLPYSNSQLITNQQLGCYYMDDVYCFHNNTDNSNLTLFQVDQELKSFNDWLITPLQVKYNLINYGLKGLLSQQNNQLLIQYVSDSLQGIKQEKYNIFDLPLTVITLQYVDLQKQYIKQYKSVRQILINKIEKGEGILQMQHILNPFQEINDYKTHTKSQINKDLTKELSDMIQQLVLRDNHVQIGINNKIDMKNIKISASDAFTCENVIQLGDFNFTAKLWANNNNFTVCSNKSGLYVQLKQNKKKISVQFSSYANQLQVVSKKKIDCLKGIQVDKTTCNYYFTPQWLNNIEYKLKLTDGELAGIIIGVILFICILVIILLFAFKKTTCNCLCLGCDCFKTRTLLSRTLA